MKKRFSITMSEEILKRLDYIIDNVNIRSRSEAIEKIVEQYLNTSKIAVFLGGGNPGELKIDGVLRPLVKIGGKYLIEYEIENLVKAGFKKIFFIGQNEMIGECFKALGNGGDYGIEINYIEEKKVLGNAKTLQLVEKQIKNQFLVLPIDSFFTFDLNYLEKKHIQNQNATVTLAIQAERKNLMDLGIVEMAGDKIVNYEEKPKKPKTFLASAFIGMYNPKIFEYIPKGNVKWVLQTDVFPKLIKNNELYGCIISGVAINVHTQEDIKKAEEYIKKYY